MRNKFRLGLYIAILLLTLASAILLIIWPKARTGPLGIGLPAKMKVFTSKTFGISIQYPESWVAFETPTGNHDDREVIAWISVPGRTWPFLSVAKHDFEDGDLDQVIQWGLKRIDRAGGTQSSGISSIKTSTLSGKYSNYSYESFSNLFGKRSIICQSFFFLENRKGYMISFCAESDIWKELIDTEKAMIDSLKLP